MRRALPGRLAAAALAAAPALVAAPGGLLAADPEPTAPPPPRASATPVKQPYLVAAMGDSLTDHRSHGGKFLEYLQERCPKSRFDNYGKGAQMVNQMRRRFAGDILAPGKPPYTHVIVFGGVNDLYSDLTAGRTPAKIEQDLTAMYQAARQRGVRVVGLTVAPWGGFTRYYNASRGAATLELNRWILGQRDAGAIEHAVDAYKLLSCGDPTRLCPQFTAPFNDGLHFNVEGQKKLGAALYDQVFSGCA